MKQLISTITLGVKNLERSIEFYQQGLNLPLIDGPENAVFFETSGSRLCLFPLEDLAKDIQIPSAEGSGFPGITLAHKVDRPEEVDALLEEALNAGAKLVKPGQPAFWGGYAACFADPDGYYWEITTD